MSGTVPEMNQDELLILLIWARNQKTAERAAERFSDAGYNVDKLKELEDEL